MHTHFRKWKREQTNAPILNKNACEQNQRVEYIWNNAKQYIFEKLRAGNKFINHKKFSVKLR